MNFKTNGVMRTTIHSFVPAKLTIGTFALLFSFSVSSNYQTILGSQEHYLPDFSYAGYDFGSEIPNRTNATIIDVTAYGALPNDGIDDSKSVSKAMEVAHKTKGPVVVSFPEGRFVLRDVIRIERSHLTLRGAGMGDGGTELYFPMPLRLIDKSPVLNELRKYLTDNNKRQRTKALNIDLPFSEYSWSGGVIWIQKPGTRAVKYLEEFDKPITNLADIKQGKRGDLNLIVKRNKNLQVGDVLQIHWHNRQGENGKLIDAIYGKTDLKIGSRHWTSPARPLVKQTTKIISVDGNRVEIADPLLHDINEQLPANFASWEYIEEVGVEGFHIKFPQSDSYGHHLELGFNGVFLTSAFNSWIRDLKTTEAEAAIITENSASVTIDNVHTKGEKIAHYSIYLGGVHNFLVRDLHVFNRPIHSISVNTRATKGVYLRAQVYQLPKLDQHAGANHQNLFDSTTLHINAQRDEQGPFYHLWDGSGAKYWQPGHGQFNTTWNTKVVVQSGADYSETVRLIGAAEGPNARIVGVHGNRKFEVEYFPTPYYESINDIPSVPSLYEYQKSLRKSD